MIDINTHIKSLTNRQLAELVDQCLLGQQNELNITDDRVYALRCVIENVFGFYEYIKGHQINFVINCIFTEAADRFASKFRPVGLSDEQVEADCQQNSTDSPSHKILYGNEATLAFEQYYDKAAGSNNF